MTAAQATGQDMLAADVRLAGHLATADWRNPVGEAMLDPSRSNDIMRRSAIEVPGTRVMLAIERYRIRNNRRVPQSLDDLGDLLPEELRRDPVTEQEWVYAPTPTTVGWNRRPLDQDQEAWPYTLRSRPLVTHPPSKSTFREGAIDGTQIATPMYLPDYAVR